MPRKIIVSRAQGLHKIRAAARAVFFFQGASYYEREVPVEDAVAAFQANPRMKLRVDPADSTHIASAPGIFLQGYRIEF